MGQNIKKLKGDPSENFFRTSLTMPKKLKGGPLISPGIVFTRKKGQKSFWFSFLGQMVQFDTIKFRRTL